jgi:hypothetical protein
MAESEGGREWIVEPPGRGEISLHVELGEGARLTREQEAALGALLASLETADAEVTGLQACNPVRSCTKLLCNLTTCNGLGCTTLGDCQSLKTKLMGVPSISLFGTFGSVA